MGERPDPALNTLEIIVNGGHAMKSGNPTTVLLVGILIGLAGGFFVGALAGRSVFHLASVLVQSISRQNRSRDRRLRFELLLQ